MIHLYFLYYVDKLLHRLGWENRYVWAYNVCNRLVRAADRRGREDLY